jgi:hypothetical protein
LSSVTGTFTRAAIEEMLRFFQYKRDGKMHLYWSEPSKSLTDGIHALNTAEDVSWMVEAARKERENCVTVDHTDFIWSLRPDVMRPNVAAVDLDKEEHMTRGEEGDAIGSVFCEGSRLPLVSSGALTKGSREEEEDASNTAHIVELI